MLTPFCLCWKSVDNFNIFFFLFLIFLFRSISSCKLTVASFDDSEKSLTNKISKTFRLQKEEEERENEKKVKMERSQLYLQYIRRICKMKKNERDCFFDPCFILKTAVKYFENLVSVFFFFLFFLANKYFTRQNTNNIVRWKYLEVAL